MKPLIGGMLAAIAAGSVCAALLWGSELPSDRKIATIVLVGALAAMLTLGAAAIRAVLAAGREEDTVERARERRRLTLEHQRTQKPGSRYGLSYDPPSEDETVLMGDKTRSQLSQKHIERLLREGSEAAAAGDLHKAAGIYTDLLDSSPDHLEARVARGRVWLDLGDFNRAMSDLVAAEDLSPDSPLPLVGIGDLHFSRKDYARAIECFDIALSIAPDHAMAWCRRGISHYYRGHRDLALEDLSRAKSIDPRIPNLDTYIAMARKGGDKPRKKKR